MLKKINQSLHLKIVLLLGICYLAFFTITIRTHKYLFFGKNYKRIQSNYFNYANLLVDKIKTFEDFDEIKKVLEKYDVEMRIIKSDTSYIFPSNMREIHFEEKDQYDENTMIGFDHGLVARVESESDIYEMVLEEKDNSLDYFLFIYRTASFVYFSLMLIIIYYLLVLLLNPINKLHKNVKEMAMENLDNPLYTKRSDELGELINSFNEMKLAIKTMIVSREQLLLDVSHELRTPLTRINLSLEMMEDSEEKNDIIFDVREMETMISELLESAKIQSKFGELEKESVNVMDLVEDVALYFNNDRPKIHFPNKMEKIMLDLDPERFKIMFRNILSNAIKYSNDETKPIEISTESDDRFFTMKIKNYGEGIPAKELDFIFEPFYRVDKSRSKKTGGYGLGMHLVRKIVEAHKGQVTIDSLQNEWTEVTIKLPR